MTDFPSPEEQLGAALAREHVLVAFVRAQDHLAAVIEAVEGSSDNGQALRKLRDLLHLDETQATAVLDMQVRRMSAIERTRRRDELETDPGRDRAPPRRPLVPRRMVDERRSDSDPQLVRGARTLEDVPPSWSRSGPGDSAVRSG